MSNPVVLQLKEGVQFPPICANCAAPAVNRITIEKNLGSQSEPRIHSLQPFFCDACIAAHRRELPLVPLSRQLRYLFGNFYIIPLIISVPLLVKFAVSITTAALAGDKNSVIFAGICMTFFACILAWSLLQVRQHARPYLLEPPTSVTMSFQFSGDMSESFEPTWRRYSLRNPDYAEAFGQLNQSLSWDRHNPEAARARSIRFYGTCVICAVFGCILLYSLYDDYIRPVYISVRDYLER